MKKNIYIIEILSLVFLGTFTGCYDLDRFPQDKLSSTTFWKTEDQAVEAVNACYQALKLQETYWRLFSMDCVSDIGIGYDDPGYLAISNGTLTSTSGYVSNRWAHSYEGIARANTVIRNVMDMNISEGVKNEVIGQAKFLRGLFYFFLMQHFGGVPLYDETTDYNKDYMNLLKPRSSAEETRAFILKDLADAIGSLPIKWAQSDYGRATKGAAYALRGKVYLYNKQYDLATKDFEEIVLDPGTKGYGYGLYSNYGDLFTQTGHRSNEMVFSIQNYYQVGYNLGMPYAFYMGSNACIGTSWNNVMPSVGLVDSYECKDGRPFNWNDFIPGYNESTSVREQTLKATLSQDLKTVESYPKYYKQLLDMYEHRDPRMKETIILPYTNYLGYVGGKNKLCEFIYATGVNTINGFIVINRYKSNYMYLYRKFVPEGDMGISGLSRANIPIDFPIIRYADVLLMLAECYNELGRLNDAVKYINMVRQRPSVNMPEINSGPAWLEARTKEAVFKRIVHERAVEFPAEGLRHYDIIRWGIAKELMNGDVTDALGNHIYYTKFEDKDSLWPIPSTEIDKNSNLTQNPGWQ
ncbi:RagB/SusD family nutrient uptake outer membrane protein [Parabacteroides sp. Marseille-P3160]|uniref:RagB/SusD family nutrient uptake outer membrane protein n=1 Tax=Parabacteroides sp. Marseille-P3160 TaxID=1917887 RepID=UPI0009B984D6|nr:RagB/SusD family nutrient uptake outer membrane protein [Parabacteroides sp. Marseille-P3160]